MSAHHRQFWVVFYAENTRHTVTSEPITHRRLVEMKEKNEGNKIWLPKEILECFFFFSFLRCWKYHVFCSRTVALSIPMENLLFIFSNMFLSLAPEKTRFDRKWFWIPVIPVYEFATNVKDKTRNNAKYFEQKLWPIATRKCRRPHFDRLTVHSSHSFKCNLCCQRCRFVNMQLPAHYPLPKSSRQIPTGWNAVMSN